MKARVTSIYTSKLAALTPEQVAFVDEVYAKAEANYEEGGQWVVECMEPSDILDRFKSMKDALKYMGLKQEQADEIDALVEDRIVSHRKPR
jgi:hypothetical protein